jgi:hypothetical protein
MVVYKAYRTLKYCGPSGRAGEVPDAETIGTDYERR